MSFDKSVLFPVVTYKCLDYVFESATRLKVRINLLSLPAPYLNESCDRFPHSGHLPQASIRTPWIRGNVIPTCQLFPDSVLNELRRDNQQTINVPESYTKKLGFFCGETEIIPSSNPGSPIEPDDIIISIFSKPTDPCQETFVKIMALKQEKENKDLRLPEKFIEVDCLKAFRGHLPSLKTKLSRLRIVPVSDPLLNFKRGGISDNAHLRRCERYVITAERLNRENWPAAVILEDFSKVHLNDERLRLPEILENVTFDQKDFPGFADIFNVLMINPVETNEQYSVLETLQKANDDMAQVEHWTPEAQEIPQEGLTNVKLIEQMKSPADLEVNVTLSPVPKASQSNIRLLTSQLNEEPLAPFGNLSLISSDSQRKIEMALWTAEKYPTSVVAFMLKEPETYEKPSDYQPFSEALMVLKSKESFFNTEPTPEPGVICTSDDFAESIESNSVYVKAGVEKFEKMSPEQDSPSPSVPRPMFSNLTRPETTSLKTSTEHMRLHNLGQAHRSNSSDSEIVCSQTEKEVHTSRQGLPSQKKRLKSVLDSKCRLQKDVDPLSDFILLRSQQAPPLSARPNSADTTVSDMADQRSFNKPSSADQPERQQGMFDNATAQGNASREQSKVLRRNTGDLKAQLESQDTGVIGVQATESQYSAFREVKSFAQPHLSFVQKLGLDVKVWGDFCSLNMEQTHFLRKQQEKALHWTKSHDTDLAREQEQLTAEITLIHDLVTFKELLFKCGLSTAIEFFKRRNVDDERTFMLLLKRLQIILYRSQLMEEANFKLAEMTKLLASWLNNDREHRATGKILVLFTNNSDNTRSIILSNLHQIKGATVADFHVDKDQLKLNGARVISRMYHHECALVCDQNVGPDFPWQSFSLVVAYDRPGPSPWATVCRERGLIHVTFNTILPDDADAEKSSWSVEDGLPYVLLVTEGLHNCPMLLQTLESTFNIRVLERYHQATLQRLGGTHQYTVITVDESTAIVIQNQEELGQDRASEALVMRLTALSLQYSSCWIILHCPESQGGGLSSEAFCNLLLVYSSLVLFGKKLEALIVKVLMTFDVMEIAKWISQICFNSLLNSDRDPVDYMDREWLTILETHEEKCLSHFPCVNPLVSQLMLKRAPNLQWLLSATLSELKEMLPEVPHKVLKLFTDTTSLYAKKTDLNEVEIQAGPGIRSEGPLHFSESPVLDPTIPFSQLCGAASPENPETELLFKSGSSCSDDYNQRSWTIRDLWEDDSDEVKFSGMSQATGKTVGWPGVRFSQQNPSLMITPNDSPFSEEYKFGYNSVSTNHGPQFIDLTSPVKPTEWGPGLRPSQTFSSGAGLTPASARYGSKSFSGQERKRKSDTETLTFGKALTPLKQSKLSYERVPGRSDGQTRLKLF